MNVNYLLPDKIYRELSIGCQLDQFSNEQGIGKVAFILITTLNLQERIALRRLVAEKTQIIIVSSLPEVAVFAWKIGVFHFIEYPFNKDQFSMLLQKLEVLKNGAAFLKSKLKLSFSGGYDIIGLQDINLINGQGDYCQIYLQNKESKTYTYRLKKIEDGLVHHLNFVKLSRSVIVNINNVAQIKGNKVYFSKSQGLSIELSARVVKRLKDNMFWLQV